MSSGPFQSRSDNRNSMTQRIPDLTYRNRAPAPETTTATEDQANPGSDVERSREREVFAQSDWVPTENSDEGSRFRTRQHSEASTFMQAPTTPRRGSTSTALDRRDTLMSIGDVKKRKHNSLLGFLSLKEPSGSALDEFARQQQKQAAAKSGKTAAVGIFGVSAQKLPAAVPKVNSKWDGLPSPVRDQRKESRNPNRDSSFTIMSQSSNSSSSHMSYQASISSGASAKCMSRYSAVVPNDGISESPKIASQAFEASADGCHADPSTSAIDTRLRTDSGSNDSWDQAVPSTVDEKHRSDSVASMMHRGIPYGVPRTQDLREVAGNGQQIRRPDAETGHPSSHESGIPEGTTRVSLHKPSESGHTLVQATTLHDNDRAKSSHGAYDSTKCDRDQRTRATRSDVLPWEVQELPKASTTSVKFNEDEKKGKLSFLRRFK